MRIKQTARKADGSVAPRRRTWDDDITYVVVVGARRRRRQQQRRIRRELRQGPQGSGELSATDKIARRAKFNDIARWLWDDELFKLAALRGYTVRYS
eukprot:COSAG06_NODE_1640_length_8833_cov_21.039386_5_plen_97_part_00